MATTVEINKIQGERSNVILSGNMYYFKYLAEPRNLYFDRFPLVFVLRKRGRLFEGINFHYMHNKYRTDILDNMKNFLDENKLSEDTRLRVKAYRQLILTSRKYRFAKAAFHRYRMENIRSRIIKISPLSWGDIILKEAEKFLLSAGGKKTSAIVHRETLQRVRGKQ